MIQTFHILRRLGISRLGRRDILKLALAGVLAGLAPGAPTRAMSNRAVSIETTRATLSAFIDTLIPEDSHSPAASHVGVIDRLILEVGDDESYRQLILAGCHWIELQSEGGFVSAGEDAREFMVAWMAKAKTDSLPRRFFDVVRDHALSIYYAQPASWQGLRFNRPPQPIGYPEVGREAL